MQQQNFPKFDQLTELIGNYSGISPDQVNKHHGQELNFAMQFKHVICPVDWESYLSGRKMQTVWVPIPGEQKFVRPEAPWIVESFPKNVLNKKSRYTQLPVYNVDKFGNRLSKNCNNDLTQDTNFKSVAFFGCSLTFGDAIEGDDIYVNEVVNGFNSALNEPVIGFNQGYGGNSIEAIRLQLEQITRLRRFDYAVFLFPTIDRLLVIDEKTNGSVANSVFSFLGPDYKSFSMFNIIPSYEPSMTKKRYKAKVESLNQTEIIYRTVDNIRRIVETCKSKNIKPLFSSWDRETYSIVTASVDCPEDCMLPMFKIQIFDNLDFGVDGGHPGPITHNDFALEVNKWLELNKEKLK